MYIVNFRPGYFPARLGAYVAQQEELDLRFPTLDLAKVAVCERFPDAVFAARWNVLMTEVPWCWTNRNTWRPPAEIVMPEGMTLWWHASIRVFPNSQWAELWPDRSDVDECAQIRNEANEPPHRGARLFIGEREVTKGAIASTYTAR